MSVGENVTATDIASRIGATFVIGEIEDILELRKMDLPVSAARSADSAEAMSAQLPLVASWLRLGDRGLSSNAMCRRIFGVPSNAGTNHPLDPDDFSRCLKFLDATEAHDKVGLMADVSPEWQYLVQAWPDIQQSFQREKSASTCPVTYQLIRTAIQAAKEASCT